MYIQPFPCYALYPFTPTVNKLYWDARSQEQIVHNLTLAQLKTQKYVNDLAERLNETIEKTSTELDNLDIRINAIEQQLEEIENMLKNYTSAPITYDPSQGKYTNSKEAMRNIYRELAIYGARANQMATLSSATASATDCLTMAVVGNYDVFGNEKPRVTPRNETTPQPQKPISVADLANGYIKNTFMRANK